MKACICLTKECGTLTLYQLRHRASEWVTVVEPKTRVPLEAGVRLHSWLCIAQLLCFPLVPAHPALEALLAAWSQPRGNPDPERPLPAFIIVVSSACQCLSGEEFNSCKCRELGNFVAPNH